MPVKTSASPRRGVKGKQKKLTNEGNLYWRAEKGKKQGLRKKPTCDLSKEKGSSAFLGPTATAKLFQFNPPNLLTLLRTPLEVKGHLCPPRKHRGRT